MTGADCSYARQSLQTFGNEKKIMKPFTVLSFSQSFAKHTHQYLVTEAAQSHI
jgi:hypothetical protein